MGKSTKLIKPSEDHVEIDIGLYGRSIVFLSVSFYKGVTLFIGEINLFLVLIGFWFFSLIILPICRIITKGIQWVVLQFSYLEYIIDSEIRKAGVNHSISGFVLGEKDKKKPN